jgi:hypothetical protein
MRIVHRRLAAVLLVLALVAMAGCAPEAPFFQRVTRISVSADFEPFVGDFDADGWDDIWWFDETGQDRLWEGRADGRFAHLVAPIQVDGTLDPVVGDFSGDLADDVVLYSGIEGQPSLLVVLQEGGGVASSRGLDLPPNAQPSTLVDGNSYDGVALRGWEAGGTGVWDPDAGSDAVTWISDADDELPVSGDFDGDGAGDIFLHGAGPRTDRVAWGDGDGGFTVQTVRNVTGSYDVVAFNADGDGRDDLAFINDPVSGGQRMNLWFGAPGRTFVRETRDAFCCRGPVYVHRSHVGGNDTLVQVWHGHAESWTIDAGGVTRVGTAARFESPWHLIHLVGRFHDGVADDMVMYDENDEYREWALWTPDRAGGAR